MNHMEEEIIAKEKMKAAHEAMKALDKQFGRGTCMMLGEREAEQVRRSRRAARRWSWRSAAGATRAVGLSRCSDRRAAARRPSRHAIAECQKAGGMAAFVDAEHALDVRYASTLGVQADRLLVSQPDSGEQALEIVERLVRSGAIDLIVVDSVAALVPRAEIEGEMGDQHVGLQARLMSQALRSSTGIAYRTQTCIMFINQLRMKIGVTFGSPETTTGGNALKFYASMRLDVRRIGQVKVGDEVCGHRVRVKVVKNKLAPPFKTAEMDVRYGLGFDPMADLLDLGVARGVVAKNGSYYSFRGESLGQGREKSRLGLLSDAKLAESLRADVLGEPEVEAEPAKKKAA